MTEELYDFDSDRREKNLPKIESTLKERGSRYGTFEENAEMTQNLMDVYSQGENFTDFTKMHLEIVHMIFHKLSRMVCGDINYPDNPRDIAGYAIGLTQYLEKLENVKCRKNT